MNNPRTDVAWMIEAEVRPGQQEALRELSREQVAHTAASEPGTLDYEWSLSADGQTCHIWERYADSAAAMVHIRTFDERYASRFFGIFRPTRVFLYGAPSAEVRQALAGLGPVMMDPLGGFSRP
jgi:quinol monooxygenase YgiN